ncbi:MAG: CPBP family intramembrane metalloprotease [Myxococcales bacterium]|nr:CPBP family intramembrane metalloprotease [Myxococcales bacterium]
MASLATGVAPRRDSAQTAQTAQTSRGSAAAPPDDPQPKGGALAEALWVSSDVTLAVGAIALGLPDRWHATLVGALFLGATWALVWRKDDATVRRSGLALGGLVIPGRLSPRTVVSDGLRAAGWGAGLLAIVAIPFFFGWRAWWDHRMPHLAFALSVRPLDAADEILAQVFVIALPEEAFYRGYLQTRLDDVWPPRWGLVGARVGPGLLVAAAIFAAGHLVTVQQATRLAVFFPALVFGWLRARTGGVGASVCFHALCNVYSQVLGRGYGLY